MNALLPTIMIFLSSTVHARICYLLTCKSCAMHWHWNHIRHYYTPCPAIWPTQSCFSDCYKCQSTPTGYSYLSTRATRRLQSVNFMCIITYTSVTWMKISWMSSNLVRCASASGCRKYNHLSYPLFYSHTHGRLCWAISFLMTMNGWWSRISILRCCLCDVCCMSNVLPWKSSACWRRSL